MAVEIELRMKRQIGGNFEITGTAKNLVMRVDVILFDRLPAFIETVEFCAGL
jgi:hypothetical protein